MDENNKISKNVDKIVMGVILGGAIGSVLGLTLAPRKGKDTRAIIKKKGQEVLDKGKEVTDNFMDDHRETIQSAKFELGRGVKNFMKWLLRIKKSTNKDA